MQTLGAFPPSARAFFVRLWLNSMPSSKLTKAQQGQLTKRQAGKVHNVSAKVEQAKDAVAALTDQRNNQRGVVGALRDDLGGLEQKLQQKLAAHPLSQKVRDKKGAIEIARTELEQIADDLADAKTRLQKALAKHDAVVSAVQKELEPDDVDDDSDDDYDDD